MLARQLASIAKRHSMKALRPARVARGHLNKAAQGKMKARGLS
ncbi:MAG: hypothetical protein NT008_05195 [Methylococcales bacterium]|nr:hypothetical protein [Methylococcales bacterium]